MNLLQKFENTGARRIVRILGGKIHSNCGSSEVCLLIDCIDSEILLRLPSNSRQSKQPFSYSMVLGIGMLRFQPLPKRSVVAAPAKQQPDSNEKDDDYDEVASDDDDESSDEDCVMKQITANRIAFAKKRKHTRAVISSLSDTDDDEDLAELSNKKKVEAVTASKQKLAADEKNKMSSPAVASSAVSHDTAKCHKDGANTITHQTTTTTKLMTSGSGTAADDKHATAEEPTFSITPAKKKTNADSTIVMTTSDEVAKNSSEGTKNDEKKNDLALVTPAAKKKKDDSPSKAAPSNIKENNGNNNNNHSKQAAAEKKKRTKKRPIVEQTKEDSLAIGTDFVQLTETVYKSKQDACRKAQKELQRKRQELSQLEDQVQQLQDETQNALEKKRQAAKRHRALMRQWDKTHDAIAKERETAQQKAVKEELKNVAKKKKRAMIEEEKASLSSRKKAKVTKKKSKQVDDDGDTDEDQQSSVEGHDSSDGEDSDWEGANNKSTRSKKTCTPPTPASASRRVGQRSRTWDCPSCTLENEPQSTSCSICNTLKPGTFPDID